ncbi:MAG: DUF4279 domain-containing protein [Alphaproteobacteria bacterium]|nr:DUF4279 domain-containing protein [Alphaproteobacteria bacterium]
MRAFATLRFYGDRLDPVRLTEILKVSPTKAWRKGERYFAGPRAGYLVGRTGTWFLATDTHVESADLALHLDFLTRLLSHWTLDDKKRLSQLREVMARDGLKADASLFWHGQPGETPPSVPPQALERLHALPAKVETDFDTD